MEDGSTPLRVVFYDATCVPRGPWPGLTASWWLGGHLYRALGRIDRFAGFSSWREALRWLAEVEVERPVAEIQYWGHGKWGRLLMAGEPLDVSSLAPRAPLAGELRAVRDRMAGAEALWWMRACETFGAEAGRRFARAWSDLFECRAAGHTFIIGPWQSGLHSVRPGEAPAWEAAEGIDRGTPAAPRRAAWSRPGAPNTITCLHGRVPAGF